MNNYKLKLPKLTFILFNILQFSNILCSKVPFGKRYSLIENKAQLTFNKRVMKYGQFERPYIEIEPVSSGFVIISDRINT